MALAGSRLTYWSKYSIILDHYCSPNWDKKQIDSWTKHSVSQIVNITTYEQGTTVYGIEVKSTGVEQENQKIKALKNQISAVESRLENMKFSVWLCQVLLGILICILVLVEKSWGSLAMITLEEIKKKLKSAGGPGNHGLGQKVSSKDFIKFLGPEKDGIQLVEMAFVVISESTTKLAGIERVALRDLETANRLYPGDVHCEKKQSSCQSRKAIGMHRYRSLLDTFASFQTTTQSICRMEAPPIPVRVLLANSEAGRDLSDPRGWLEEGFMTSTHRLASGRNTISKYYVETVAKRNMGRRNPRSTKDTTAKILGTLFPGWTSTIFRAFIPGFPPLFALEDVLRAKRSPKIVHVGQWEDPERWRTRRSPGVTPYITGTLPDSLRIRRFSPIVAGMGVLAASQVAQLIGTAVVEGRVSRLETRVETLNVESKKVVKRIEASMSIIAKAVDLNARFDEVGQLLSAANSDLSEFGEVMSSMANQNLDSTTRQEGMGIVTEALETQAELLKP